MIGTIEFQNAEGNDVEVTLKGKPENIVGVLVRGLPREALEQIAEAFDAEITKRHHEAQNVADSTD